MNGVENHVYVGMPWVYVSYSVEELADRRIQLLSVLNTNLLVDSLEVTAHDASIGKNTTKMVQGFCEGGYRESSPYGAG